MRPYGLPDWTWVCLSSSLSAMTDKLPRLLTEAEAAAYLGIKPRTLARMRLAGKIQCVRTSERHVRYLEQHLSAFIVARAGGSIPPDALAPKPRPKRRILVQVPGEDKPMFPKPRRRVG